MTFQSYMVASRAIAVFLSLSRVWLSATPETVACQTPLSSTISRSLLRFTSTESVMLSNHLTLWCPLLLLPSIFASIRVFSNESALCIGWPEYCSFSFNISPSSEYSGLTSFRIDWFDLHAVQGTLKNLLRHYNSKASILWRSAFFMIQLSQQRVSVLRSLGKTAVFLLWGGHE